MECLGNPHNFSSNPGWIDTAIQKGKEVAKAVTDKYESVKQAYHSGIQESKSLGKELPATQSMYAEGQKALDQGRQQEPQK